MIASRPPRSAAPLSRSFPRSVSNGLATLSGLPWMERRRRPLARRGAR